MTTYVPILDSEVDAESPVTVSLMTRLRDNALSFLGAATATKMLFRQAAAPLGWTKDTFGYNHAIRVVGGALSDGGSVGFSTVFSRSNSDSTTLNSSTVPSLTVNIAMDQITGLGATSVDAVILKGDGGFNAPPAGATNLRVVAAAAVNSTVAPFTPTGGGLAIGGGGGHSHGMDIRVLFLDFIMASRDA